MKLVLISAVVILATALFVAEGVPHPKEKIVAEEKQEHKSHEGRKKESGEGRKNKVTTQRPEEDTYSYDELNYWENNCNSSRPSCFFPNVTKIRGNCSRENPGIDQMLHITLTFSDCDDLTQMGKVLAERFWDIPVLVLTLKFFKWLTMPIPHDYRNAGSICFFSILVNQPIPNQYMARLSRDCLNLYKMQTQIPESSLIGYKEFLGNPLRGGVRMFTSLYYMSAVIIDVLGPTCLNILLGDSHVFNTLAQGVIYIAENLIASLTTKAKNLYLGSPESEAELERKGLPSHIEDPLKEYTGKDMLFPGALSGLDAHQKPFNDYTKKGEH